MHKWSDRFFSCVWHFLVLWKNLEKKFNVFGNHVVQWICSWQKNSEISKQNYSLDLKREQFRNCTAHLKSFKLHFLNLISKSFKINQNWLYFKFNDNNISMFNISLQRTMKKVLKNHQDSSKKINMPKSKDYWLKISKIRITKFECIVNLKCKM